MKVSELITHRRLFSRTAELVKDFGLIADLLGPSMGCFLFQLPPKFTFSRARLARIVSQLDSRHRNVVEFLGVGGTPPSLKPFARRASSSVPAADQGSPMI